MVSKTGRAEISEDPMGPEQTDVFIMLKPAEEWTTGATKPELVAAMQQELADDSRASGSPSRSRSRCGSTS